MKYITILFLVILNASCNSSEPKTINSFEPENNSNTVKGYEPSHPIYFPHAPHAEIDCRSCHEPTKKMDEVGISRPSSNICIDCHSIKKENLVNTTNKAQLDEISEYIKGNKNKLELLPAINSQENSESCFYLEHPNASEEQLSSQDCKKCH